ETEANWFGAQSRQKTARRRSRANPEPFATSPKVPLSILQTRGAASPPNFRADRARSGSCATAQSRARLGVAASLVAPNRPGPRNKVDRAIPDRNRKRARSGRPIPKTRAATRSHRVVSRLIANLPGLPPDVVRSRVAQRKG